MFQKIILILIILLALVDITFAKDAERINDNCYKYDGVLVCGSKISEQKEVPQIEPKKDDEVIIKTSWEFGDEIGVASFYTVESSSNLTASGEAYDENSLTCASMDYPFGTILKVTNIENNKFVIVRVNDRGNFKKYGRIIDLSKGAFEKIANLSDGLINVKIEVVNP